MRNDVSGEITVTVWNDVLKMADQTLRDQLTAMATGDGVAGVMVYECIDLSSKRLGHKSFMIFGPGCTYKTIEEAAAGRLGDVPSRFQYPKYVWLK